MNAIVKQNKILIVEDDITQRLFLRMALEVYHYDIFEAENGQEAYHILNHNLDIHLVITDIKMPVMDGFELIRTIRAEERKYTYILVTSAVDGKRSVIKALGLGADDFISKPVTPEELHLRLEGASRLLRLESQDEFILSMAKMSEYRSNETGYHLERVKFYTQILASDLAGTHPELGISRQFAAEISTVSPLHDLGKIAIPDNILHKPEKLTNDEFEIMKTHTTLGGNLLMELFEKTGADYLNVAYEIAMYHHERWDGTGYPKGLQGEKIPIVARIMAVADAYDAMANQRCYKQSYDHKYTKSEIINGQGTYFDPIVVESFLRQEGLWLMVTNKYKDKDKDKDKDKEE